ncbi:non-ribosomal peptide synthetase [Pseudomonas sp. RIT-PI-AD]|uniref:non-ribosomal peptide synthetase n=1 Tax=Pseudomonas sp. RIT-PI-AD TaxID=3035294 RepID=UPI0021D7EE54|nr:non-ribosomal peptide synthetase [Pseudomonas sp. RIT-PI-AD]
MSSQENPQTEPATGEQLEGFPLSPLQTLAWRRYAERPLNRVLTVELADAWAADALVERLEHACREESQLRVAYRTMPGMSLPVQVLEGRDRDLLAWQVLSAGRQWQAALAGEAARLAASPLGRGAEPVVAASLVGGESRDRVLAILLAVPPFVADESSLLRLLQRALNDTPEAAATEDEEPLLFQHFSEWANEALGGEAGETARGYWQARSATDATAALSLPEAREEGTRQAGRQLPQELLDELSRVGLPEACALLAWTQVAGQFLANEEAPVALDRLVSGRVFNEFADLVGPFSARCPLQLARLGEDSVRQRVNAIEEAILAQEESAVLLDPFGTALDPSRANLAFSWIAGAVSPQVAARVQFHMPDVARFLELAIEPHSEGRYARVTLHRAWDREAADRLADAWLHCLQRIAEHPDEPVGRLPLIGAAEQAQLRHLQGEPLNEPQPASLVEAFERIAGLRPTATAVVDEQGSLSFAELQARSESLARALLARGIQRGQAVAAMTGRSREAIVALLGIIRAGAVYAPINPDFPRARMERMRDAADIRLAVADAEHRPRLEGLFGLLDVSEGDGGEDSPALPLLDAHDAAYMIFTSGTTGQPKGVIVEHRSALNLAHALRHSLYQTPSGGSQPELRVTVNAPFSFDSSIKQILQLLSGHTLYPVPQQVRTDPQRMLEFLGQQRIDVLDCTPSLFRLLIQAGLDDTHPALPGRILVGGEAFDDATWQLASKWSRCEVFNLYGPTEATVNATLARVRDHASPTLGKPLPNVAVHIVDPLGRLKSQGAAGEIWIGGRGVARGYAGDPVLSAERFRAEPWPGAGRVYRSGDLARWRSEGGLEFLGRIDEQVKVNGYRIELGEIRSALLEHPGVREAAAVTDNDGQGNPQDGRRIAAFVTPRQSPRDSQWLEVDLPSGHRVAGLNLNETEYVFNEIFVDAVYSREGIALPADAVVLDVGANIGLFSLYIASCAPAARILAFEPLEPIRRRLLANLERYAPQVQIYGVGLSDSERDETFTYYPGYSTFSGQADYADASGEREVIRRYLGNQGEGSANLLLDNIDEILDDRLRAEEHLCHLKRLDQVIRELGLTRIDLLKIDVQRAEMDVLLGLDREVFARISQIVLEVHDKRDSATAGRVEQLSALLREQGFEVTVRQDALLEGTDRYNCYAVRPGYADALENPIDWRARHVPPVAIETFDTPQALEASLQAFLETRLPAYMLPSRIGVVASLPLTLEGKLDRKALLALQAQADRQRSVEAPTDAVEAALADIWSSVLKRPSVGVTDNFFQIGGDSIRLIQMQVMAREAGLGFTLRDVFSHQSIRELAKMLKARGKAVEEGAGAPPVEPARQEPFAQLAPRDRKILPEGLDDAYPMTRLQLGMVMQTEIAGDPRVLHNVVLHRIRGRLDAQVLTRAWALLIARHPILRTGYDLEGYSEPLQLVHEATRVPADVAVHDLSGLDASEQSERLRCFIETEHRTPFQWAQPPLVRVAALRLAEDRFALSVAEHHSALDGWSLQRLVNELVDLYDGLSSGAEPPREEGPDVGFGDYVALDRQAEQDARSALFWLDYLAGARPAPLPTSQNAPGGARRVAAKQVELPEDALPALRRLGERTGLPLRSLLLAVHARTLGTLTGSAEALTGFVTHGRPEEPGADRVLGLFLNTVPCRLQVDEGRALVEIAQQAFEFEKRMLEHRRHPLAAIRRRSRAALFDSLFNFVDFHQGDEAPDASARRVVADGVIDQVVVDVDVPLAVDFEVEGERLKLGFQYDARRFDEAQANAFARAYRHTLDALLAWQFEEPRADLTSIAKGDAYLGSVIDCFGRALGRPVTEEEGFLDAGGHSLLAVRIIAELRQATGRHLGLDLLHGNPTALEVARRCQEAPRNTSSRLSNPVRSLWLHRQGDMEAPLRLFAFPPAGGNAGTYGGWRSHLPADVELVAIQYPGRQGRQDEPFVTDFERMVGLIIDAMLPLLDRPFVLAGASLGGVLAFEVANRLRVEHGIRPERLFVVSSRAPAPGLSYPPFHAMGDATLTRLLQDYEALPAEVIEDSESLAIALATLRADSRLSADYRYRPQEALDFPITVVLGEQDKGVSRTHVEGWKTLSVHGQDLETLAGGHGIVVTAAEAICKILRQRLKIPSA